MQMPKKVKKIWDVVTTVLVVLVVILAIFLMPMYADSRFVSCQFPGDCTDRITVKEDGIYTDLFTDKEYTAKGGILEFEHTSYQMMMFAKK